MQTIVDTKLSKKRSRQRQLSKPQDFFSGKRV
jgi:hypothetical protein